MRPNSSSRSAWACGPRGDFDASPANAESFSVSIVPSSPSMSPDPWEPLVPIVIFGTTSTFDCSTASAKRFMTCCTSWNCGPP